MVSSALVLNFMKTFHSKEQKSSQHHPNWNLVTDLKTRQNLQQREDFLITISHRFKSGFKVQNAKSIGKTLFCLTSYYHTVKIISCHMSSYYL